MKTPKGFKLIGHVYNDSGMLAIVDPCYVSDGSEHNPFTDWDAFCNAINKNRGTNPLARSYKNTVVVGDPGERNNPVYARIVNGEVAEVRIVIEELPYEVYEKESE